MSAEPALQERPVSAEPVPQESPVSAEPAEPAIDWDDFVDEILMNLRDVNTQQLPYHVWMKKATEVRQIYDEVYEWEEDRKESIGGFIGALYERWAIASEMLAQANAELTSSNSKESLPPEEKDDSG